MIYEFARNPIMNITHCNIDIWVFVHCEIPCSLDVTSNYPISEIGFSHVSAEGTLFH